MDFFSAIDRHAQKALGDTATRFEAYIKHRSSGRHLEGYDHKLAAERLVLEQTLSSKLFGRIYTCNWRWQVPVDLGEQAMHLRLRYLGWRMASRKPAFVGHCPAPLLEVLNSSEVLLALCTAMDLGGITIDYRAPDKHYVVTLRPNYGDFVWLLIPPLRYVRQPSVAEVGSTVLLIHELSLVLKRWTGSQAKT
ncbi:hypothetical protein M5C90_24435 [Pseudomonas chlororaphis subsp. piscium]|uniref:hypothetical protein n=1 Tax=Pseudomonas chlororaphis TaxID=587753 RepID=UPI000F5838D4|nr:hypothetical protein [Pseudomonas chlororaphis]AZD86862.1 hypothetical protein C4K14_4040 [Pseudomonas chlororaphis subsp. aureofaciens]UQS88723.1 hypothetical protein M5C90_24435 [Pseudomonas chlororaphis subsp. piscium]